VLNFIVNSNNYKITSDLSVYKVPPMIHNQTLVRKQDGRPHYKDENVEKIKNLSPVITEHYNVTLYNEKNKQLELLATNRETVPVFLTNHTTSFHHFLIDVVGKILYLNASGVKNLQIVIILDYKGTEDLGLFLKKEVKIFHKEIFNILGLPDYESCIINIAEVDKLNFKKVVVAESCTGNMDNFYSSLMLIKNKFVKKYSYENKIYVSRGKSPNKEDGGRRVSDDEKLAEHYANKGHSVVYFEDMTFQDQVDLVSSCSEIVSYNGSSMVNTLFAPKGCKITEIRNSVTQQHDAAMFWSKWFEREHRIVECFGATTAAEIISAVENFDSAH
jgi:hypothetical protein